MEQSSNPPPEEPTPSESSAADTTQAKAEQPSSRQEKPLTLAGMQVSFTGQEGAGQSAMQITMDGDTINNPYAGVFIGKPPAARSAAPASPPAAQPAAPAAPPPASTPPRRPEARPAPPPAANKVGRLDTIFSHAQEGRTPAFQSRQAGEGELKPPAVVEREKASLSGRVLHDLGSTENGSRATEGLANVVVTLTGSTDAGKKLTLATTTDEAGIFFFRDVPPGRFTLARICPEGFLGGMHSPGKVNASACGTLAEDHIEGIVLPRSGVGTDYHFLEILPASLQGAIYGADAELDEGTGEFSVTGLEGLEIELAGEDFRGRPVQQTARSGLEGRYGFYDLPPGLYLLKLSNVRGFRPAEAQAGDRGGDAAEPGVIADVQLYAGEAGTRYDFYCQGTGRVAGKAVVRPRPGARPMPLPGVELVLTGTGSHGRVAQRKTVTDGRGAYQFADLPPGLYRVQVEPPEGWDTWHEVPGKVDGRDSGKAVHSSRAIDGIDLRQGGTAAGMDFIAGLGGE